LSRSPRPVSSQGAYRSSITLSRSFNQKGFLAFHGFLTPIREKRRFTTCDAPSAFCRKSQTLSAAELLPKAKDVPGVEPLHDPGLLAHFRFHSGLREQAMERGRD